LTSEVHMFWNVHKHPFSPSERLRQGKKEGLEEMGGKDLRGPYKAPEREREREREKCVSLDCVCVG